MQFSGIRTGSATGNHLDVNQSAKGSATESSCKNLFTLGQVSLMVDNLKSRLGMKDSIAIKETTSTYDSFHSFSRNLVPGDGGAEITINLSQLSSLSTGEREFTILHELVHIKHKDGNLRVLANVICLPEFIGGAILFGCKICPHAGVGLSLVGFGLLWCATRVTKSVFNQFCEIRADHEAFRACSLEGKKGAFSFLDKCQEEESAYGTAAKVVGYAVGFLREGIVHPPLPIRIRLLRGIRS